MTNILDILIKDHSQLKGVMDQIEKLGNESDQQHDELFSKFKTLFKEHDEAEEDILYPQLKLHKDFEKLANKGKEAHHIVNVGIVELRLVPFSSERWLAKFAVIHDSILSHMEEEEQILFPKAKELFGEKVLEQLGQKVLDTRAK